MIGPDRPDSNLVHIRIGSTG